MPLRAFGKTWPDANCTLTGGIGSRAQGEGFGPDYELNNHTAYCETCASIANVYWNHRMFLATGDSDTRMYWNVLSTMGSFRACHLAAIASSTTILWKAWGSTNGRPGSVVPAVRAMSPASWLPFLITCMPHKARTSSSTYIYKVRPISLLPKTK